MDKKKYAWLTDLHLFPWKRRELVNSLLREHPDGIFLTGDISHCGYTLIGDLEYLARYIRVPIYFVLGNHDYWGFSFAELDHKITLLLSKYPNLIWMDEQNSISLNEETCIIGNRGWYDAGTGNPDYLKYTLDWILIKDFKSLPNMADRILKFKELAEISAKSISKKLTKALKSYKTIYLLTHMPPYLEAHRCNNLIDKEFWTPYNCNIILGDSLKSIMDQYKKRNLIILSGHTHSPCQIHVSRNIECRVGKGSYYKLSKDEILYI